MGEALFSQVSVCSLFTFRGGGGRIPHLTDGGLPHPRSGQGGTPIPGQDGAVVPHLRSGWGRGTTPSQVRMRGVTPLQVRSGPRSGQRGSEGMGKVLFSQVSVHISGGYPIPGQGRGLPPSQVRTEGVPHLRSGWEGVPPPPIRVRSGPRSGQGGTPSRSGASSGWGRCLGYPPPHPGQVPVHDRGGLPTTVTTWHVLATWPAVCLLRSHRKTLLLPPPSKGNIFSLCTLAGGYPSQVCGWGYPITGLGGGVPHPRSGWWGVPPTRSGWWGVPRVPPTHLDGGGGYPPNQVWMVGGYPG